MPEVALELQEYLKKVAELLIERGGDYFIDVENGTLFILEQPKVNREDLKKLASYQVKNPADILSGYKKELKELAGNGKKPVPFRSDTFVTLNMLNGDVKIPGSNKEFDYCNMIDFSKILDCRSKTEIDPDTILYIHTIYKHYRKLAGELTGSGGEPLADALMEIIDDVKKPENYSQEPDAKKYQKKLEVLVSHAFLNTEEEALLESISKGKVTNAHWLKGIVEKMIHSITLLSLVLSDEKKSLLYVVSQYIPWLKESFAKNDGPAKRLQYKDHLDSRSQKYLKETLLEVLNDFRISRRLTLVPLSTKQDDQSNQPNADITKLHPQSLIELLSSISYYNNQIGNKERAITSLNFGAFASSDEKLHKYPAKFLTSDERPKLTNISDKYKGLFPEPETRLTSTVMSGSLSQPTNLGTDFFRTNHTVEADNTGVLECCYYEDECSSDPSEGMDILDSVGVSSDTDSDDGIEVIPEAPHVFISIKYSADIGSEDADAIKIFIEHFPDKVDETAIGIINVTHLSSLVKLIKSGKVQRIKILDFQGPFFLKESVLKDLWDAVEESNLESISIATIESKCLLLRESVKGGIIECSAKKFFEDLSEMSKNKNRQPQWTFEEALNLNGHQSAQYDTRMNQTITTNKKECPPIEFAHTISKDHYMYEPISAALYNNKKVEEALLYSRPKESWQSRQVSNATADDKFLLEYQKLEYWMQEHSCNRGVYNAFMAFVGSTLRESANFNGLTRDPELLRQKAKGLSNNSVKELQKELETIRYCFIVYLEQISTKMRCDNDYTTTIYKPLHKLIHDPYFTTSDFSQDLYVDVVESINEAWGKLEMITMHTQGGVHFMENGKRCEDRNTSIHYLQNLFYLCILQRFGFVFNLLYETKQTQINDDIRNEFCIAFAEIEETYNGILKHFMQQVTDASVSQQNTAYGNGVVLSEAYSIPQHFARSPIEQEDIETKRRQLDGVKCNITTQLHLMNTSQVDLYSDAWAAYTILLREATSLQQELTNLENKRYTQSDNVLNDVSFTP
jgi:hypothetical protein